jgi:hypothetical protein
MKNNLIILTVLCMLTVSGCSITKTPVEEYLDKIAVTYNLPPDPGVAGDVGLSGVDVNENGVRDEVEREIYLLIDVARQNDYYPDLAFYELNVAKSLSLLLTSEKLITAHSDVLLSIRSLQSYVSSTNKIFSSDKIEVPSISKLTEKDVMKIADSIRNLVYNTEERQNALVKKLRQVKLFLNK